MCTQRHDLALSIEPRKFKQGRPVCAGLLQAPEKGAQSDCAIRRSARNPITGIAVCCACPPATRRRAAEQRDELAPGAHSDSEISRLAAFTQHQIASERRTLWSAVGAASRDCGGRDAPSTALSRRHRPQPTGYASRNSQPHREVSARLPQRRRGVITLAGVEHCFMYVVQNDVVDTVIGPPDYIEQVFNEGRQDMQEGQSPLPRKDHD